VQYTFRYIKICDIAKLRSSCAS